MSSPLRYTGRTPTGFAASRVACANKSAPPSGYLFRDTHHMRERARLSRCRAVSPAVVRLRRARCWSRRVVGRCAAATAAGRVALLQQNRVSLIDTQSGQVFLR